MTATDMIGSADFAVVDSRMGVSTNSISLRRATEYDLE